jgi:hypothetical protein
MINTLRDSPVFICGHPGAGTNLLRAMLESCPAVIVYPEETNFFRMYLPNASGKSLEKKLELADRYLIQIFQWNRRNAPEHQAGFLDRDYSGIAFAEVQRTLRELVSQQFRHDGDMLSAAMLAFASVTGQLSPASRYWLEETPFNEWFARQIFELWPRAKCIHVVRDPRDNYVTYRQKHPEWTARFFAATWERSTRLGLASADKYGPERYWLVSYEQFATRPEETWRSLCQYLGIADDAARQNLTWKSNPLAPEHSSSIRPVPIGRWKEELSPAQVAAIEGVARTGMRAMGYNQSVIDWKNIPGSTRMQLNAQILLSNLKEKLKWLK